MNINRGVALVTALSIMVVVAVMIAGTFLVTQIELGITRNDATSVQAQYVAASGLEKYKAALFQYYRYIEDNYQGGSGSTRTACYSRLAAGLDWNRNGNLDLLWNGNRLSFGTEIVNEADGTTRLGSYEVFLLRDPVNHKVYTLESRGESYGARSTMRATVMLDNTGVLEQAIFSGLGQSNKFINGGTTIRGGIYVVGDEANADSTVFQSNGNFALLNDYDLTESKYAPIVNNVTSVNRKADQLCATLRVMDGRVELNGSVQIGGQDNPLLGVYIGDNIEEDLIINATLTECETNKGICAEDGPKAFDITREFAPRFPTFASAPSETSDCDLSTWRDCLRQEANDYGMAITFTEGTDANLAVPTGAAFGTEDVRKKCLEFLSAGRELVFGSQTVNCVVNVSGGRRFGFNYSPGNPGSFEVFGSVDFRGYNLTFTEPVDYFAQTRKADSMGVETTRYNATIVVEAHGGGGGDIDLNGRMRAGTGTGSYPGYPDHVLAFVAENDIFQGGDFVMAPLYAGGTYRIVSDNTLIGSVVSNYFCTTSAGSGASHKEIKDDSKSASDKCNAGQKSEVVYVNTGDNKPDIMQQVAFAGFPVFQVLSTEVR